MLSQQKKMNVCFTVKQVSFSNMINIGNVSALFTDGKNVESRLFLYLLEY